MRPSHGQHLQSPGKVDLAPCRKTGTAVFSRCFLTGAFYVGNGWVAGGCWDDEITNVMTTMDHSRKFPAF